MLAGTNSDPANAEKTDPRISIRRRGTGTGISAKSVTRRLTAKNDWSGCERSEKNASLIVVENAVSVATLDAQRLLSFTTEIQSRKILTGNT